MRDPTAINPKVEAAIEAACEELKWAMKHGLLKKGPVEPDALLRYRAHDIIEKLPDEVLPAPLRDYVCNVLFETPKGLKRGYGGGRDLIIAEAIDGIVSRGFHPTRNDATRAREECGKPVNQSACSIAMEALRRVGVPLSERTIEGIYLRSFAPESSGKLD